MAPLARFLVDKGYAVFGWDDFATEERKKQLSFVRWQETVPNGCAVCVYSPAVDEDNALRKAASAVCPCMPRGAFVAQLLKSERLCVICGSHGKSTTTAYLIHFFKQHNLPVNYIGGAEFQKNFYTPACGKYKNAWTLLELDESDGTIDAFSPDTTVILNADWDHPRHYPTAEAYRKVFENLALRTKECVISNEDFPLFHAKRLRIPPVPTLLAFDAAAAGEAFRYLTGQTASIADTASFPGIKRRQEILLQTEHLKVLSDYAHHPSELQALLQVLKREKSSLVLAFEPHRASRLKCYFEDFVRVLKDYPKVYIHPLYEAFEATGCNEKNLLEALPNAQPLEQLKPDDYVACEHPTTIAFIGAGKIDAYARRWVEHWTQAVKDFFERRGVMLKTNVSLRNASLMGIGGSALFICEPKNLRELQTLLHECRRMSLRIFPLGGGSNVLIPEDRIDGVIVRLNGECWNFCTFGLEKEYANASEEERVNFLETSLPEGLRKGRGKEASERNFSSKAYDVASVRDDFADGNEPINFAVSVSNGSDEVDFAKANALGIRETSPNEAFLELSEKSFSKHNIRFPAEAIDETSEAVYVHVGAGMHLQAFLDVMEARGIGGFEFLDGIPGTVGGALAMNAGTEGKGILDVTSHVFWMDEASRAQCTGHSALNYGYRSCETFKNGIILSAVLRGIPSSTEEIHQRRAALSKKREQSQPKGKMLGCFFKNPPNSSAGRLLEQCGAKGKREGGIFVSERHANFIINNGNGRLCDVIRLVRQLRTTVHERSGVWLEPEVRILGRNWEEFL